MVLFPSEKALRVDEYYEIQSNKKTTPHEVFIKTWEQARKLYKKYFPILSIANPP